MPLNNGNLGTDRVVLCVCVRERSFWGWLQRQQLRVKMDWKEWEKKTRDRFTMPRFYWSGGEILDRCRPFRRLLIRFHAQFFGCQPGERAYKSHVCLGQTVIIATTTTTTLCISSQLQVTKSRSFTCLLPPHPLLPQKFIQFVHWGTRLPPWHARCCCCCCWGVVRVSSNASAEAATTTMGSNINLVQFSPLCQLGCCCWRHCDNVIAHWKLLHLVFFFK